MKKSIFCAIIGLIFRGLGVRAAAMGSIPVIGKVIVFVLSPIIKHASKISNFFFVLAILFLVIHFVSKFLRKRREKKLRQETIQEAVCAATAATTGNASVSANKQGDTLVGTVNDINYF